MTDANAFVGPAQSQAFERELRELGFQEIQIRRFGPAATNEPHQHPFEVRGFVLEGEATITCDGVSGTYRPGDTFRMAAGVTHTEAYGPDGYAWLIGKRFPSVEAG